MSKDEQNLQVKFRCACGHRLLAPLRKSGHRSRCPGCGTSVVVPDVAGAEVISLECGCGEEIAAGADLCPRCSPVGRGPDAGTAPAVATEDAPTDELIFPRAPRGLLPVVLGLTGAFVAFAAILVLALGEFNLPAARPESPGALTQDFTPIASKHDSSQAPEEAAKAPEPSEGSPATAKPPPPPKPQVPDPPPARDLPPSKKPPAVKQPPSESPYDVATKTPLPPRPELPAPGATEMKELSQATFSEKILPILDASCMSCHAKPGLPVGGFVLTLPGKSGHGAISRKKNFDVVVRFARRDAPDRSPLVLKPLALEDGGAEHGGGDNFRRGSLEYTAFVAFAAGAEPSEVRPLADAGPDQEIEPGRVAKFDGERSREPGGRRLKWEWRIVLAPAGSEAKLANADGREASLKADVAGTWVLELAVIDPSRGRSLPSRVRLRAKATAGVSPVAPSAARVARIKTLVARVFGLEADASAAARLATLSPEDLANDVLADPDFWRVLLARDLACLDLMGPFAPDGFDLAVESARWANGEGNLLETWKLWLADSNINRRFPDSAVAACTLLARLAGERVPSDSTPPPARGLGPELLRRDAFASLWFERQHRALLGSAPAAAELARWVAAWKADPAVLRGLLREWLVRAAR
ncbi:MAG: hypothetical protein AAB074_14845 [Planctomycetota bacterium]